MKLLFEYTKNQYEAIKTMIVHRWADILVWFALVVFGVSIGMVILKLTLMGIGG
jgi:hypothetical protein